VIDLEEDQVNTKVMSMVKSEKMVMRELRLWPSNVKEMKIFVLQGIIKMDSEVKNKG
jgi:hypothetical protein